MNNMDFIKGIGVGVVAGATIGMAISPIEKKKNAKSLAGRVLKTAGQVVENIASTLGM